MFIGRSSVSAENHARRAFPVKVTASAADTESKPRIEAVGVDLG
jgi:hypothetical protein